MLPSERYTILVLSYLNILNYMDRYAVVGILTEIQKYFQIGDDLAGLLHSGFIISFVVFAPLFGYLGDRYSRRWILMPTLVVWSATSFLGSFTSEYVWFLTCRILVGMGEAAFSTLAPSIVSDICVGKQRSQALGLFYFAVPVGSGLGYICGSKAAEISGKWRWGLRVTPLLGIIGLLLLYFTIEPERGLKDILEREMMQITQTTIGNKTPPSPSSFQPRRFNSISNRTYSQDLCYLMKNRSFVCSTIGLTSVMFAVGSFAWWGPKLLLHGFNLIPNGEIYTLDTIAIPCGLVTIITGLIGVPLGPFLSQHFRPKYPRADPIICTIGMIIAIPSLIALLSFSPISVLATFVSIIIGQIALNSNLPIIIDILLYVVMPTTRSSAAALQIFISHAFGDAISPYFIGVLSENIKVTLLKEHQMTDEYGKNMKKDAEFKALQMALFSNVFILVIGVVFHALTAVFVVEDRQKAFADATAAAAAAAAAAATAAV